MVLAAPPQTPPARKKKSGPLPDGVEQHSLDTLLASLSEVPERETSLALATESQPTETDSVPRQLDFDALTVPQANDVDVSPREAPANRTGSDNREIIPSAHRSRKAKKQTALPSGIYQPTLDTLFATTSPLAFAEPALEIQPQMLRQEQDQPFPNSLKQLPTGEAYRPAPHRRSKAKKTGLPPDIDQPSLFAIMPEETQAASVPHQEGQVYEQPRQDQPGYSDTLAELSSEDAGAISTGEPAGSGTGGNGATVRGPDVRSDGGGEDGLSVGLGDGASAVPAVGRGRVILDEPEPEPQLSRDFRIKDEHRVGSGGLHEKATANIAAIRLLKVLEEENREATEEEKAVLVRYSGWGALAGVFEPQWNVKPEWRAAAGELQQLLTEEEYASARATTPNAHFTSPLVIQAIWDGLEKLGVSHHPTVLEPAMGIGHFFGIMPESLQGGQRTGVELDSITARIAKKLYPDAKIFEKGFEATKLPDNYFDVVVGNVPFGDYAVHDPAMKPRLTRAIHDYFFAKSLEKVRPGGIMALITSRYTMDKQDDTLRKALAEQADLVAAIRLPNTAFKGNAGTEVTTDILFLQKRPPGREPAGEAWIDTQKVPIEGSPVSLNEYYVRHPEMMLGEMQLAGRMYRNREPTLTGELTQAKLEEALHALPESVYAPRSRSREPPMPLPVVDPAAFIGIKDGSYALIDGQIVIRNGDHF